MSKKGTGMSRNIDLTKPLSDEDREYLDVRGRYVDIKTADALAAGEEPPAPPLPVDDLRSSTVQSPTAVPASEADRDAALAAGAGSADATADSADDDGDNYDDDSAWTYAELQAEAKERELSAGGSREDIIARLRENDAEQSA